MTYTIRRDTICLGPEHIQEAYRHLAHLSDGEIESIPALAPEAMRGLLVLEAESDDLIDGAHRVLGVARWAQEQGIDLNGECVELPVLLVPACPESKFRAPGGCDARLVGPAVDRRSRLTPETPGPPGVVPAW